MLRFVISPKCFPETTHIRPRKEFRTAIIFTWKSRCTIVNWKINDDKVDIGLPCSNTFNSRYRQGQKQHSGTYNWLVTDPTWAWAPGGRAEEMQSNIRCVTHSKPHATVGAVIFPQLVQITTLVVCYCRIVIANILNWF